jgi:phenylacetate-CoA ligase
MSAIFNPRYETMDRGELLQLQLERLQAQPEDFQSLADLRQLPFTTKGDLRGSYPYDLVALPLREVVRFHVSSGTTGAPTVIAYTANDLDHWTDLVARNLVAGEITCEDVVQIFFGYGLFSGGFGLHQGAERIRASVLRKSCMIFTCWGNSASETGSTEARRRSAPWCRPKPPENRP